jgi:hypothetical protein
MQSPSVSRGRCIWRPHNSWLAVLAQKADMLKGIGQGLMARDFLDESHREALGCGVAALAALAAAMTQPATTKRGKKK